MASINLAPLTGPGSRVYHEVPAGAVDGANSVYKTASVFVPGTEAVYFNGRRQDEGAGFGYVISESVPSAGYDTLTLCGFPLAGDSILVDYTVA